MTQTSQSRLAGMQKNSDHAMRLLLARPGESAAYGGVKQVWDFSVAWNDEDPSRMSFKTFKHSPGASDLQEDVELIVELWEPWTRRWIQPPNSRFVVEGWKEDLADPSNRIEYSAIQSVTMLDKTVLHRRTQDRALNSALNKAQEAFDDAESDFNSAWSTFQSLSRTVRRRHYMYRGRDYAQVGLPAATASRRLHHGSFAVAARRSGGRWVGALYYRTGGKWKRLSRAKWPEDKATIVENGLDVVRKRRVMLARKEELRKATVAARETSVGGRRYFHNRSAGYIIHRAMVEAQQRDTARGFTSNAGTTLVKGVRRSFSNNRDSRKRAWVNSTKASMEFQLGQGTFSMLKDLQEKGLCDWQVRNATLDIVPRGALAVNRSSSVSIRLGKDLSEAVTNGSRTEHASAVLVIGGKGGAYEHRTGNSDFMETPWGFWEGSIAENAANAPFAAGRLTQDARNQMSRRFKLEPSRKVVVGQNSPLPMVDYMPHHTISVYESTGSRNSRKVKQIVLTQGSATEPLEAVVTFETRFQSTPVQFTRSLAKTTGGIDFMQGKVPLDQSVQASPEMEAELRMTNLAPPISEIEGSVKFNDQSQPFVSLRVGWDAGYEAELPPIPEEDYAELVEEEESDPEDDGFEEEGT